MAGKVVQHWNLRRALDLGEPRRASAALAMEIGYVCAPGTHSAARVEKLMARARSAAAIDGDPYHLGLVEAISGGGYFLLGQWRVARAQLEAGLRVMRDHGINARWEIDVIEMFHLAALAMLGELRELATLTPTLLHHAEDRGDVYAQNGLRSWRSNLTWLVLGKPDDARAHLLRVASQPNQPADFHLHGYHQVMSAANVDLYLGDGEGALARVEAVWPKLERARLLRVQSVAVEVNFVRGRASIAAARGRRSSQAAQAAYVAMAKRSAAQLVRLQAPWSRAAAALLTAGVAHVVGDLEAAVTGYAAAESLFSAVDMRSYEQAARLARGEIVGGTDGRKLVDQVAGWMRDQQVADPVALSRMFVPR
jgi:hypothetical protein